MGGSIESETNAETVVPAGRPAAWVVTTETGPATLAIAARNASCSAGSGSGSMLIGWAIRRPFRG
jgi:hypothetical protein